ncbi:MAG: SRPBCC family protein [Arthrobacter sp.]
MKIDSAFSVVAPIDTVWETVMDFERVAGCIPGAKILNKLSDDAYQVGLTVKLGPVNMQYKGLLNVIERNAAEHRAVLGGKAQETRGQGLAEATVTLLLTEEADGTTRGTVSAELSLSGKAAAMGKGVIGSVTEQMMALFASNLQSMTTAPDTAGGTAAAGQREPVPGPVPAAEEAAAKAEAAAPVPPPAPPPARAGSLNTFSLAKGMAAERLSSPGTVLVLVAVVACTSYWAGRRSALRLIRTIGRVTSDHA